MADYTYSWNDLDKGWRTISHPQYDNVKYPVFVVYLPISVDADNDILTITDQPSNIYLPPFAYPTICGVQFPLIGDAIFDGVDLPTYTDNNTQTTITTSCTGSSDFIRIDYSWLCGKYNKDFKIFGNSGGFYPSKSHGCYFSVGFMLIDSKGHWIGTPGTSILNIGVFEPSTVAPNLYVSGSKYQTGSISVNDGTLEDFNIKLRHYDRDRIYDLYEPTSLSEFPDPYDPNHGDGDSHGGGGGGTDDLGGDTIEDTGVPTIEATDSGLMTLYNPTVGELQALGRFLWSDGLDLNSFKKLFNDPFDTLLGLSIIPIVPPTSGTKKIMFGNLDSGVTAKVISHQFVPDVDMGTVTLGEVYNGALDYSPFTTVSIYLPFIGYRELNVQDIMNSKIHLVYKFDVLTGGCIAELYVDHLKTGNKSKDNSKFKWGAHSGLLASFEGQCAVNIPLASQDYTNTIRAMIGAVGMVGGAAASFATGNPALGVAALAVGSANSSIQASTPTVQRSGHLSSSNAIMANLTPFLTVTRPHQCKPANYYKLRGVPSQIYVSKLSSLVTSKHNYYLQVAEIPDIKVAGATDTEIAEIKNLLKEGVVL